MTANPDLTAIGLQMVGAGLPSRFVFQVLELARQSEGAEDLLHLWVEAADSRERGELEADLHGMLEDREPAAPRNTVDSTQGAERSLDLRRRQKEHLRRLVSDHGGVSEVARRADMPQPSLSRLLTSMAEPRPATLHRLAEAMNLPVAALYPPPEGASTSAFVFGTAQHGGRRDADRLKRYVQDQERHLGRRRVRMEAP